MLSFTIFHSIYFSYEQQWTCIQGYGRIMTELYGNVLYGHILRSLLNNSSVLSMLHIHTNRRRQIVLSQMECLTQTISLHRKAR